MSIAQYASYDAVGMAELLRKHEVNPIELVEGAIERTREQSHT